MFKAVPSLKVLDQKDEHGEEVEVVYDDEDEDDEGEEEEVYDDEDDFIEVKENKETAATSKEVGGGEDPVKKLKED